MVEEGKSQKVVESYKAVAAGIASVVAALFTSKLGVAGTLIGTALTGVMITLTSAILKVQLMKATDTISGLPSAVQGRLPTQQIRIPGKPNPEPNPEPAARPDKVKKGRFSNLLSRLRAVPGFLKRLPSNQRRRTLLAGLLAGLVATGIGLVSITGIEAVAGENLSCLVWSSSCPNETGQTGGSSRGSGLSILGGSSITSLGTDTPVAPSSDPSVENQPGGAPSAGNPSGEQPSGEQPSAPGDNQQAPQQRNPEPAQPGDDSGVRGQPGETPPEGEQPGETPPGGEDRAPQQPGDQQPADKKGSLRGSEAKPEAPADQKEPSQKGEAPTDDQSPREERG